MIVVVTMRAVHQESCWESNRDRGWRVRTDRGIEVRPTSMSDDYDQQLRCFLSLLLQVSVEEEVEFEELANEMEGYSGADITNVCCMETI